MGGIGNRQRFFRAFGEKLQSKGSQENLPIFNLITAQTRQFFQQLLPNSSKLYLEHCELDTEQQQLTLSVLSTQHLAKCPVCSTPSTRTHSHYRLYAIYSIFGTAYCKNSYFSLQKTTAIVCSHPPIVKALFQVIHG